LLPKCLSLPWPLSLLLGSSSAILCATLRRAKVRDVFARVRRTIGQQSRTPGRVRHGGGAVRTNEQVCPTRRQDDSGHERDSSDHPIRTHQEAAAMDTKLQRRIQRYGWDLAADAYERLWRAQLAPAQAALLATARLVPGERVLDVACGTGLVTFDAARAVGPDGHVLGVDLSDRMVDAAESRASQARWRNVSFACMDAEQLTVPDASFDVVLCALGLMYMPDPEKALREMRRVLRPGGRLVSVVWGERSRCGWSAVFEVVDDEVRSEVCPLFFRLGQDDALARLCARTQFEIVAHRRIVVALSYASGEEACDAAFVGGPVALAWSRFGDDVRERVRARYLEAIRPWRCATGYDVPGEFVIVGAAASDLNA
jgi:ubiquinone/menaquinone biosynthesis C-methylase UbiE